MLRLVVMLAVVAFSGVAHAQTANATGSEARFKADWVTDQMAADALAWATANITNAVDERGQKLLPLTGDAATTPLLDSELVKEIMDVGRASAAGQACRLNWQDRNYLKLMGRERRRGDRSVHQLAAIGMIHGRTMGSFLLDFPCPQEQRDQIGSFYARKWQ